MSSFRNAIPRRAHKERSQPQSRERFGKLKEKASFKNPDEFYFKMINTNTVHGVHRPESEANKFTTEELILMKTQDMGYILQMLQGDKKKLKKLRASLHSVDNRPSDTHVYYAEDSDEAEEIRSRSLKTAESDIHINLPRKVKKKTDTSYKELKEGTKRVNSLESIYTELTLKKELQKRGKKRKLREDELDCPTTKSVYKWCTERKR